MPDLTQDRNMNVPRETIVPRPQPVQAPPERVQEEKMSAEVVGAGSLGEALCGIAAIVLAIVGLGGLLEIYLAAIAAIVIGAGLLLEGAAIGTRFSKFLKRLSGHFP